MDTATLPQQLRSADLDLATFFLDRLEMLTFRLETARDPRSRSAFSNAAFSVFLDCVDLGLELEARRLLEWLHAVAA